MSSCVACGIHLPPAAVRGLCQSCEANRDAPETMCRPETPPPPPVAMVPLVEFQRHLVELGLIGSEDLARYIDGAAGDATRLAQAMLRAGKLTPYQAGAILQGKARGLVVGDYLIVDKLGRGGMGVVFKARRRGMTDLVALKILPPSFARDREAVERFRREFEVATRLKHLNVVAALAADGDRNVRFIVMELIDGHNLDDLVADVGPLPINMALSCAIQAARGLEAAHGQKVVHRDVKPGNLILDGSGTVRVLDLGLARVIESANPFDGKADTAGALTRSGAYMGTVDYVAPEQAEDSKRADHRADIYSLGCTLYFLLTGRPPFTGKTLLERLTAHRGRPAPSLCAARDGVPAALEAAYQRMMAKRPDDRPSSMTEVIGLLEVCQTPAGETKARTGLRDFAETVMKRASPKKRRGLDATIFARPAEPTDIWEDPDLTLEDLITDFRPEHAGRKLDESELPPLYPRPAVWGPSWPKRRRGNNLGLIGGVAAVAALLLFAASRPTTLTQDQSPPEPAFAPVKAAPAEPPAAVASTKGAAPGKETASTKEPAPAIESASASPKESATAKGSDAATPAPVTFDPNAIYRLTNEFTPGKSLSFRKRGRNVYVPVMAATGDLPAQRWKIIPLGDGYFRLISSWQPKKCLDIFNDGESMDRLILNDTNNFTGQLWKITPLGNGVFRLTSHWQPAKSLDIENEQRRTDLPVMRDTGNFTGQFWRITDLK